MSGLIPAAGEKTFWQPNMLSLVSFAGMILNKCAVLWIGTLTGGPVQGESPPVLVKELQIQTYSRTSVCGRTYLGVVYRKHLYIYIYKKNPYLPFLTFFWSANPKHTYFLFGPAKHAKHFEKKMAELTYAELTQGRESTRLPHTHRFTSLENVVISALHKIDKRIHI